eukprot:441748-Alexandrium_andersonii.AAC.1
MRRAYLCPGLLELPREGLEVLHEVGVGAADVGDADAEGVRVVDCPCLVWAETESRPGATG